LNPSSTPITATSSNSFVLGLPTVDSSPTGGVPTLATNTPGITSGANTWLKIQLNSGTYYIPVWSE
jgi:hypothetical protein